MGDRIAASRLSPLPSSPAPARPHRIVLYGKPGCHLCEIAEQLLLGLALEFQLTIDKVDVRSDAFLLSQFQDLIPVVSIDGRIILTAPIRMQDLRAALT